MRYKKELTCKEWARFDRVWERVDGIEITGQEIICQRYEIILTDYQTKGEKARGILSKFNMANLDKGLKILDKGLNEFDKKMDSFDRKMEKLDKELREFKI